MSFNDLSKKEATAAKAAAQASTPAAAKPGDDKPAAADKKS